MPSSVEVYEWQLNAVSWVCSVSWSRQWLQTSGVCCKQVSESINYLDTLYILFNKVIPMSWKVHCIYKVWKNSSLIEPQNLMLSIPYSMQHIMAFVQIDQFHGVCHALCKGGTMFSNSIACHNETGMFVGYRNFSGSCILQKPVSWMMIVGTSRTKWSRGSLKLKRLDILLIHLKFCVVESFCLRYTHMRWVHIFFVKLLGSSFRYFTIV